MSYCYNSITVISLQGGPGLDQGRILLSDDCICPGQQSFLETTELKNTNISF